MSKAVVLLSGGLDSTTTLARALRDGRECVALNVYYGSKHNDRERGAAELVARYYEVSLIETSLPTHIFSGKSSLTNPDIEQPEGRPADLIGPDLTEVPYRNGNLLSLATSLAVGSGYDEVWFGAHAEDARNWAYPDCTPEFLGAMSAAIWIGSNERVRLVLPWLRYMRRDLVTEAVSLGVPIELTWTCYVGGTTHCGTCPSCVERRNAFESCGLEGRDVKYQA